MTNCSGAPADQSFGARSRNALWVCVVVRIRYGEPPAGHSRSLTCELREAGLECVLQRPAQPARPRAGGEGGCEPHHPVAPSADGSLGTLLFPCSARPVRTGTTARQ